MKRCSECRRDYYDDSLLYCLDDGAPLLEGPSIDEPATAVFTSAMTEHKTEFLPTNSVTAETFAESAKASPLRRAVIAIVGLAAVALAFGGYFYYARAAKQIESIAVMPFVSDGGNADVEYLSDGMTETLIKSLSGLPGLD